MTAGALRWRDGTWLRRPAPERLVKALGEPLVVIRRSDLTKVLADALADGTVHTGLSRAGAGRDGRRRAGHDVGLDDARGSRGHRRRRHPLGGRPPSERRTGRPLRRLHGMARGGRLRHRPRCRRRSAGPRRSSSAMFHSDRTTPIGSPPSGHRRDDAAPQGELDYLKARFGSWTDPIPAVLAATDPDDVLRNDLYDRDRARQWSRGPVRRGRATRRTRCDRIWARAAARASRTRRCWRGSSTATDDLAAAFARFAAFRRPRVRPAGARIEVDRTDRQPAAGVPQRPREPGDRPGTRSADDAAPGRGGGAFGVRAAQRARIRLRCDRHAGAAGRRRGRAASRRGISGRPPWASRRSARCCRSARRRESRR